MTDLDYGAFDALTFDCYGTLIDWEAGILTGLRRALRPLGVNARDAELLKRFATAEGETRDVLLLSSQHPLFDLLLSPPKGKEKK